MKKLLALFLMTVLLGDMCPAAVYAAGIEAMERGSQVQADESVIALTDSGSSVEMTKSDFMSGSDYAALGFNNLTDSSKYVDDEYDPMEGYQPQILNELYIGHLNHPDDYQGYFGAADNLSSIYKTNSTEIDKDALNLNSMQNNSVGGKVKYYDYSKMQTQCISAIGLIPGDLNEEGAQIREEILIESRLYQDTGGVTAVIIGCRHILW